MVRFGDPGRFGEGLHGGRGSLRAWLVGQVKLRLGLVRSVHPCHTGLPFDVPNEEVS